MFDEYDLRRQKCHHVSEEHWKERLTEDGREIEAKMELTDNSSHD